MIIKNLLLIGALTFAPLENETLPTEPITGETTPSNDNSSSSTETSESDKIQEEIKAWLEKWLEPSQVAMVMTWITYAATIVGLIVKISNLAKQKTLTAENVKDLIMDELGDKVDESVKKQLETAINSIIKTTERQNEVLELLTKVAALSQENTPESRLAILDLISRLGVVDKEDIENAKDTINNEVEEKKALEEETNKAVDKIIESHEDDGTTI